MHVEVTPVSYEELAKVERESETSAMIRERVITAREIQTKRFEKIADVFSNAQMPSRMVREVCQLDAACTTLLKTAMERLQLSARAYDRILKVARTNADLSASQDIQAEHLAEAIQYRSLDKENWVS